MDFSSAGALSVLFILFQTSETAFCCKQYTISGLLRHTFSRTALSEKLSLCAKENRPSEVSSPERLPDFSVIFYSSLSETNRLYELLCHEVTSAMLSLYSVRQPSIFSSSCGAHEQSPVILPDYKVLLDHFPYHTVHPVRMDYTHISTFWFAPSGS